MTRAHKTKTPWEEVLDPTIDRFRLAADLGMSTTFNAVGSAAMAQLLRNIQRYLDLSVRLQKDFEGLASLKRMETGVWVCSMLFAFGFGWLLGKLS